jgi:hypothetical protein
LIVWGDHDQIFPLEMATELKEYVLDPFQSPLINSIETFPKMFWRFFSDQYIYIYERERERERLRVNCMGAYVLQASWGEGKIRSDKEHGTRSPD